MHSSQELSRRLAQAKFAKPLLGLATTLGIIGLRLSGLFQIWELHLFDWMMRSRPPETPDPRIVIVGIYDADLERLNRAALSDALLAQLITKVKQQSPSVIGLDLYRNIPHPPGHQQLNQVLRNTPNLIGIEKLIDDNRMSAVSGNSVLVDENRTAASDLIVDADGRVRRGFLFPSADGDRVLESFGYRVAYEYLAAQGIMPDVHTEFLTIKGRVFPPVEAVSGGYVWVDSGGYQVLLNWRLAYPQFVTVSMTDLLSDQIPPQTFKDCIILIGSLQSGEADIFFTAHSGKVGQQLLPTHGVEIHAILISQLVSAVLDNRPILKTLTEPLELLLIWGLAHLSLLLYGWVDSELRRLGLIAACVGSLLIVSYGLLLVGWWLPILPYALAVTIAPLLYRLQKLQRLQALSLLDELTQLANRRAFRERLETVWVRAVRSQTPLSLILCDIDYFKHYNDAYGHLQGDACLRQVAQAIKQAVTRPHGMIARYGGEEFVILLPETPPKEALQVAQTAALNVQALQLAHKASRVSDHITISVGVTGLVPCRRLSPETLFDIADLGLYEAKRRGRNQTVLRLP
ncbi:MAG: diguanylate cyclase [Leptolyngbya sp. SIO4C1]|nr:diguanylate cyclase [Leptolyngbya sp. SIO4C1]